ncbi:MAG TPA: hypothetical protein VK989_17035, partial [Polyangia bacterium]|nr:hypothetical protein [Polyangia bacterium]
MNAQGRWKRTTAARDLALVAAALAATSAGRVAAAEPPAPAATPAAPNLAAPDDADDAAEAEIDPLAKIAELEARLDQQQSVIVGRQPRVIVGGYIDLGFFATEGNGSGIVRDQGHALFPQYSNYGWLFYGDILSTAVNTRGEVADLGDATGAPPRFDSIHSGGAPGFIANEINLNLTSGLGPTAIATASINFTPRTGSNFSLGDSFDADIAQL